MRKATKWILPVVCLAIVLCCGAAAQEVTEGTWDNLQWTLTADHVLTISGTGDMSDFSDDSSEAWRNHKAEIKSVVIESGVTGIGEFAFYQCGALTSVTIPGSVAGIGKFAFSGCTGLTGITLPQDLKSIGSYAFSDCGALTGITIPQDVTGIGAYAFARCGSLKDVTLPKGIENIGNYTFSRCGSLTAISIPRGVTLIGEYAFAYCGDLADVTIPEGVTGIGKNAFYSCGSLTEITIPKSVTGIGDEAFFSCGRLSKVYFAVQDPAVRINFGDGCFDNGVTICCYSNTAPDVYARDAGYASQHLEPPPCVNHVAVVDEAVAPTCTETGLTEGSHCGVCGTILTAQTPIAAIGHSWGEVTYTWTGDYASCTAVRTCARDNSHTEAETAAATVTRTEPTAEAEGQVVYTATFVGEGFAVQTHTEVLKKTAPTVPPAYTDRTGTYKISNGEAAYAKPVKSTAVVTIPDVIVVNGQKIKVTSIADKAFRNNRKLTTLKIGKNVRKIGKNAFRGCIKLKTVKGGTGVTGILNSAFSGCKALTVFPVMNRLKTIGASAFLNCKKLARFTLGRMLEAIGKNAFRGCAALKTITVKTAKLTEKTVKAGAFKNIFAKAVFKCPKKQKDAYGILFGKAGAPKTCVFK